MKKILRPRVSASLSYCILVVGLADSFENSFFRGRIIFCPYKLSIEDKSRKNQTLARLIVTTSRAIEKEMRFPKPE
jgi:hypothetical protein